MISSFSFLKNDILPNTERASGMFSVPVVFLNTIERRHNKK